MALKLKAKNLWEVSCKAMYGELPVALLVVVL
jgi:hypothetical protein